MKKTPRHGQETVKFSVRIVAQASCLRVQAASCRQFNIFRETLTPCSRAGFPASRLVGLSSPVFFVMPGVAGGSQVVPTRSASPVATRHPERCRPWSNFRVELLGELAPAGTIAKFDFRSSLVTSGHVWSSQPEPDPEKTGAAEKSRANGQETVKFSADRSSILHLQPSILALDFYAS